MRRTLIPVLAVLITLCQPAPADAMWWAWLEKWSGPGPFKAKPFRTFLFTACVQEGPNDPDKPATVEEIVGWRKRWLPQPSPIARSDAFHEAQDAIAKVLYANRQSGDSSTQAEFYQRLLANPQYSATLRMLAASVRLRGLNEKPFLAPPSQNRSPDAPRVHTPESPEVIALARGEISPQSLAQIYGPEADVGPGHAHERMICGYFDIGSFESEGDQDPERGFPPLTARVYDFGPSARIHDGIDIGAGLGWVHFSGPGVDRKQGAFTPFRVIIRPILLALPDTMRQKWMGVFSFYWKETYVWGRMTGADFGAPQSDWVEDGEMIRSFGINLDLTALLPVFPLRR